MQIFSKKESLTRFERVMPYLAAILVTIIVCASTWPGGMSYDPLRALEEARGEVLGGLWPPMGAYVFRLCDWIYRGPGAMFVLQNFLVFFSVVHLLRLLGYGPLRCMLALAVVAFCPATFGTFIVVWKDTATAACVLLSLVMLLHARQQEEVGRQRGFLLGALFFAFAATAYRYNGLAACFPLLAWMADLLLDGGLRTRTKQYWVKFAGVYVLLLAIVVGSVWGVNHYRIPDLKPLDSNGGVQGICLFDLVGMSRFSGEMLAPEGMFKNKKDYTPEGIKQVYHPEHLVVTLASPLLTAYNTDYCKILLPAVVKHPLAYVLHHLAVVRHLFSIGTKDVYLPTHEGIDDNALDVVFVPSKLGLKSYQYIYAMSHTPLGRPWFYYLLATGLLVFGYRKKTRHWNCAAVIYASGMMYILLTLPVLPAADLRYNHWSLIACLLSGAIILFDYIEIKYRPKHAPRYRAAAFGLFVLITGAALVFSNNIFFPEMQRLPRALAQSDWKAVKPLLKPCQCGSLEKVEKANGQTHITGWAYDVKADKALNFVHVYVNGAHPYSAQTTIKRPDVAAANKLSPTREIGFSITLPEELKDYHVVVQKADGSFAKLTNSP